jgi:hypothetical protein
MTPEQQLFWSSLKCDAHWFAHEQGAELAKLHDNEFHQTVDNLMRSMTAYLTTPDICSVIKTWLNIYQLPLDATKLGQGFDQVHTRIGSYIMNNAPSITPVEVIK